MLVEQIILVFHVLIACAIVGLILLQQGKGADMGASFGAGGSQTLFGASGGGNALTTATAVLATLFFVTSFGLAIIAKQKTETVSAGSSLEMVAEQIESERAEQADAQALLDAIPESIPDSLPIDDLLPLDDSPTGLGGLPSE